MEKFEREKILVSQRIVKLHKMNRVLLFSKFLLALFCARGQVIVVSYLKLSFEWSTYTQNCEKSVTITADCATDSV